MRYRLEDFGKERLGFGGVFFKKRREEVLKLQAGNFNRSFITVQRDDDLRLGDDRKIGIAGQSRGMRVADIEGHENWLVAGEGEVERDRQKYSQDKDDEEAYNRLSHAQEYSVKSSHVNVNFQLLFPAQSAR